MVRPNLLPQQKAATMMQADSLDECSIQHYLSIPNMSDVIDRSQISSMPLCHRFHIRRWPFLCCEVLNGNESS